MPEFSYRASIKLFNHSIDGNGIRDMSTAWIQVTGTLVLSSQQPKAQLLQTGLKGRKLMESPARHKGSPAVEVVKKVERDGEEHKTYSLFS